MLHLLGVDLGTDLMPAGPDNPKGFWEHGHIVGLHIGLLEILGSWTLDAFPLPAGWERREDIGWYRQYILDVLRQEFTGKPLWGIKDPRLCRLVLMWHEIFPRMGVNPLFVLMMRDPFEVAASLKTRGGLDWNHALLLSLGHILESERQTRGQRRVVVRYDELMANWQIPTERIRAAMGRPWPNSMGQAAPQIAQFLDPNLQHARAKITLTAEQAAWIPGVNPNLSRWSYAVHHAMTDDPRGRVDEATMDRVYHAFGAAKPHLMAWRIPRPPEQKFVSSYQNSAAMLTR
jgi:hypothetical protein